VEDSQESESLHETGAGWSVGSVPGNALEAGLGGAETEEIEVSVENVESGESAEIVESAVSVESASVESVESAKSKESMEIVQTEIVENASAVEVQVRDTDQVAVEEADRGSLTAGAVREAALRVVLSGTGQSPGTGRLATVGMSGSVNPVLQELHSEQQLRFVPPYPLGMARGLTTKPNSKSSGSSSRQEGRLWRHSCSCTALLNQRQKLSQSREMMRPYPGWTTPPSSKSQLLRARRGNLGTGTDWTRPMNRRMERPSKCRSQDPMTNHHDRKPCRRNR